MPWFDLKDLTETALKAIWGCRKSLPPIKNQVLFPIQRKVVAKVDQTASNSLDISRKDAEAQR